MPRSVSEFTNFEREGLYGVRSKEVVILGALFGEDPQITFAHNLPRILFEFEVWSPRTSVSELEMHKPKSARVVKAEGSN